VHDVVTPTHFSECGSVFMPNKTTLLTLSNSTLNVAKVLPPDSELAPPSISFLAEATVKPTLNKNARLHLLHDEIFAFGGGSTAFRKLNLHLFKLTAPASGPEVPGEWSITEMAQFPKHLQHFTQVTHQNKVVILGETYFDEINDLPCSIYVYDPSKDEWSTPAWTGDAPKERTKLLAFSYKNEVHVLTPNLGSFYDLYVLNTNDMEWRKEDVHVSGSEAGPSVRANATVTVMGDYAVVFGGTHFGVFLHDIAVFDLRTHLWVPTEWQSGVTPAGRTDHGAVAVNESQLLVFGGNTHHIGDDNKIVVVDLEQKF
jgi:hypothetical protein